jgi:DNA-3-methyladenine glycosylase I
MAEFDETRIESLLTEPGIMRNRLRVTSEVKNTEVFLRVQGEFGGHDGMRQ